jgi:hypothetical protein
VLSKYPENALYQFWGWTLNESCSSLYVEETLFLDQELDQLGNESNRCTKIYFAAVFST